MTNWVRVCGLILGTGAAVLGCGSSGSGSGAGAPSGGCSYSITTSSGTTTQRCAGGWSALTVAGGEVEYDNDPRLQVDFAPVDLTNLPVTVSTQAPNGKTQIDYTPDGTDAGVPVWVEENTFALTINTLSTNAATLGNIGTVHGHLSATLVQFVNKKPDPSGTDVMVTMDF